jgi:hypothetical protein
VCCYELLSQCVRPFRWIVLPLCRSLPETSLYHACMHSFLPVLAHAPVMSCHVMSCHVQSNRQGISFSLSVPVRPCVPVPVPSLLPSLLSPQLSCILHACKVMIDVYIHRLGCMEEMMRCSLSRHGETESSSLFHLSPLRFFVPFSRSNRNTRGTCSKNEK